MKQATKSRRIPKQDQIFGRDCYGTYMFVKNMFRHKPVEIDFPESQFVAKVFKTDSTSGRRYMPKTMSLKKAAYLGTIAFKRYFSDSKWICDTYKYAVIASSK